MTAKDIIKIVLVFVNKENLLDLEEFDGNTVSTENEQKDISHIIRCLNLVCNQIASEYLPLLNIEKFSPTNGKIEFSNFTKKPIDIYKIEDKFGLRVHYKLFPNYIETIDGEVSILYSYAPQEISTLNDNVESFSEKISSRIIAYGVAMEYCFICGLHDDASIWEKRFKDSLLICKRKKTEIILPKRRWN